MPINDISSAINTSDRFVKETRRSNVGFEQQKEFLLRRAVVTDINRQSKIIGALAQVMPAYSVAAIILDEDIYSSRPDLQKNKRWYAPLLPINNIAMPEVGEEIFVIKEQNIKSSFGFWVGRVNNNYNLNFYPAKDWNKNTEIKFKNGPIKVNEMNNDVFITPRKQVYQSVLPFLDGDVIQQGRSGTFIRHSFNPTNKNAVLELGINIKQPRVISKTNSSLGYTKTKTLHLESSSISDLTGQFNIFQNNFDPYISLKDIKNNADFGTPLFSFDNTPQNIILNISQSHYNISTDAAGTPVTNYLYRQVLGDRNKEVIEELIDTVRDLKDFVGEVYDEYKNHVHEMEGQTFRYGKKIGKKLVRILFKVNGGKGKTAPTEKVAINDNTYGLDRKFPDFEEDLERISSKLDSTLSKTQFIQ